jgi:hypothetical protein
LPMKRPPSMSLEIPPPRSGPPSADSHSPLEGLQSFANMSIGSSPQCGNTPVWMSSSRVDTGPQTLVAAYRVDEQRCAAVPQNLYFYSLTSSPTESEEETYHRKARLRYHQPPPPMSTSYVPMPPSMPLNVQSATSSPRDVHMNLPPPTLPHFHDTFWHLQPNTAPASHYDRQYEPVTTQQLGTSVPSAPFANAGPPGVQFYATPMQRQQSSPSHYSYHNWSRNRRF